MGVDAERLQLVDTVLQRNLGWIAAAEGKIGPMLGLATGMLGVLAARFPTPTRWTPVEAAVVALAVVPLIAAMLFLGLALFPQVQGPKGSIVFFGGISEFERDKYVSKLLGGVTEDVLRDFAGQCHRNGEIAKLKYGRVRVAGICLLGSVVPWLASVAMLYASPQAC